MNKKKLFVLFTLTSFIFLNASDILENIKNNKKTPLPLDEVLHLALNKNLSIKYEEAQKNIGLYKIDYEKGVFEPTFKFKYYIQNTDTPNGVEESLNKGYLGVYRERIDNYEASLNLLSPIGTQIKASIQNNKKSSNLIRKYKSHDEEYTGNLGISLTQPLLQNAGEGITNSKVTISEIEYKISKDNFNKKVNDVISSTIENYWNLYSAAYIYKNWQHSLKTSKELLKNIEAIVEAGKLPYSEIYQIQSEIYMTQSELLSAKSRLLEEQNKFLTLLNETLEMGSKEIFIFKNNHDNFAKKKIPNFESSYAKALNNLSEFQVLKKKHELLDIQKKVADNYLLPKLDIIASVNTNNLDDSSKAHSDLLSDEFITWYTGVELNMPIFGNKQAISNLKMTNMQKKQLEFEKHLLENTLTNSLKSRIENLKNSQDQFLFYQKGNELKQKLVEIETEKLLAGKSNVRNITIQERERLLYYRKYMESFIKYKISELAFDKITGTLLTKYNLNGSYVEEKEIN